MLTGACVAMGSSKLVLCSDRLRTSRSTGMLRIKSQTPKRAVTVSLVRALSFENAKKTTEEKWGDS